MFGIDESPRQSGGRQKPWNLRRTEIPESAAELQFTCLECLLDGVFAHQYEDTSATGSTRLRRPSRADICVDSTGNLSGKHPDCSASHRAIHTSAGWSASGRTALHPG